MRWLMILPPPATLSVLLATVVPTPASASFAVVRTFDGLVSEGEFGYACVVVGDMDGDGIADFAIGAPGDDAGGDDAGRVFVYRGGHPLDDEPDWVITGAPGERLGHALAVSNVDADSRPDLVIGAPGSTGTPATLTGRIVVAYGGSPLGARALASVPGTTVNGRFGWSVEGIGFSSPDHLRFLVGAPEAGSGAGEVHGLSVGDPPATRLFVLHGEAAGEKFGYALAYRGHCCGVIGPPAFLVGAPEAAGNGTSSGRFALYEYNAPNDTLPVHSQTGAAGARLGQSLTGGHDINSNFFEPTDDYVIGAPGADPEDNSDAGSSWVYADMSPFTFDGESAQAELGSTVRLMTDVTGSWLPDLAITESGAVRIYTGPLDPFASPVSTLLAEAPGDGFGHAISNAGRIDPVYTRAQFLIGAPDHAGSGRVYVFTDPSAPTGIDPSAGPAAVSLAAPAPNPSRSAFSMAVELPRPTYARLGVFDLAGRTVATLHDGPLGPGRFAFTWTPSASRAAGLYWGVLEADGVRLVRRMIRVR
ncbi:MAG TPA: integrin alpha [Candidatus Limnocylindria bacterium]|nr:integrin alpha [Candidatus Limnocylindria bacterium]